MLWGTALTVAVTAIASGRAIAEIRNQDGGVRAVGSDESTDTCSDACARAAMRRRTA
jgi:hypothetical protein